MKILSKTKTERIIVFSDDYGEIEMPYNKRTDEAWKMVRATWYMFGEDKKVMHVMLVKNMLGISIKEAAYLVRDAYDCETQY